MNTGAPTKFLDGSSRPSQVVRESESQASRVGTLVTRCGTSCSVRYRTDPTRLPAPPP